MRADDLRLLFEYNFWANARILRAAEGLSEEQLLAPAPFPSGSLRGTLVHTLSAEWIWRQRWQGQMPRAMLAAAEVPTMAAIRERWEVEEAALRALLATLNDEDVLQPLAVVNTRGVQQAPMPLWQLMLHLVNHGTQHRSEAAAMLTAAGRSPGDMDLVLFLRERASG